MAWDDAKKAKAIELYTAGNPTPENTMEVVKEVAEQLGETANGVRMILSKAEVYVKAEGASKKPAAKKADGEKSTRVSKADSIAALVGIIESTGVVPDTDIIEKLTGKQAVYFAELLKKFV